MTNPGTNNQLNIIFLHPNLGIGGAERLIIDSALALQSYRHNVEIYTSYHNTNHAFSETIGNGPLAPHIHVHGSYLPNSIYNKFYIVFAIMKSLYCALVILLTVNKVDVIIVDQLSVSIPLLRLIHNCRVMFYCHYPDLLLNTNRQSLWVQLYRLPADYIEYITTSMSDIICVNSQYTLNTLLDTFHNIKDKHPHIPVLYPATDTNKYDTLELQYKQLTTDNNNNQQPYKYDALHADTATVQPLLQLPDDIILFTSINRYERKKNIQLSIQSFSELKLKLPGDIFARCKLVIAGGYDDTNRENIDYYPELRQYTLQCDLTRCTYPATDANVIYMKNITDLQKYILLYKSTAVLYTPTNEHFGIVPIESMYCYCPVIACNTGGPLESIQNNVTGYLCNSNADEWSNCMMKLCIDQKLSYTMGKAAHQRVIDKFSYNTFKSQLNQIVLQLAGTRFQPRNNDDNIVYMIVILIIAAILIITIQLIL